VSETSKVESPSKAESPVSLAGVKDDEMFVECAVAARADYLVTGDKGHLLGLRQFGSTTIVAVSDFLRVLGVPENPS